MGWVMTLGLTRAGEKERCENRADVVRTLHEALDLVNAHMGINESADVYITIRIPHDENSK